MNPLEPGTQSPKLLFEDEKCLQFVLHRVRSRVAIRYCLSIGELEKLNNK